MSSRSAAEMNGGHPLSPGGGSSAPDRGPSFATRVESGLMSAAIVIPARWASTRFPGKPLARIAGMSLIERVYRRAAGSTQARVVYVATDDERIQGHVVEFGGRVVRPEGEFGTGTDRIAAAVPLIEMQESAHFDQIVNVQGDEPLIDIADLDTLI